MLTLWGAKRRFCDGVCRRDFLRVGMLGGALALSDLLRLRAQAAAGDSPRKAVIMVCLNGGPSHIDMYDLKPDAPAEIRGEFRPAATNVPGFDISELMPLQARIADKLAVVRSVQWPLDDAPFFMFNPRLVNRPMHNPRSVLEIWQDEFLGMWEWGGLFDLTMHPQLIGHPSRLLMLRALIRFIKGYPGVFWASAAELARHWLGRQER